MKIKVCEKNRSKIEKAIEAVQAKAKARTIDADDIFRYCDRLSDTYKMIPKKALNSATFEVDKHAQSFPGAYHGIPESTQFELAFTSSGGFFLTEVKRTRTRGGAYEIVAWLPTEAKEALLSAYTTPVKYGL